jgi:hypothetical protein
VRERESKREGGREREIGEREYHLAITPISFLADPCFGCRKQKCAKQTSRRGSYRKKEMKSLNLFALVVCEFTRTREPGILLLNTSLRYGLPRSLLNVYCVLNV